MGTSCDITLAMHCKHVIQNLRCVLAAVHFEGKGDRKARKQSKDKKSTTMQQQQGNKTWQPRPSHAGLNKPRQDEKEAAGKRPRPAAEDRTDDGDSVWKQQHSNRKDKRHKVAHPAGAAETDAKVARLASYARLELRPSKTTKPGEKPARPEGEKAREGKDGGQVQKGPKLSRAQKKNLRRSLKRAEKNRVSGNA